MAKARTKYHGVTKERYNVSPYLHTSPVAKSIFNNHPIPFSEKDFLNRVNYLDLTAALETGALIWYMRRQLPGEDDNIDTEDSDEVIEQLLIWCKNNPSTAGWSYRKIARYMRIFTVFTGLDLHGFSLNLAIYLADDINPLYFKPMYQYCLGKNLPAKEARKYYRSLLR